jgi:hypothetical protein
LFLAAAARIWVGSRKRGFHEASLAFEPRIHDRAARANPLGLNPTYLKQRERICAGWGMAGVLEG